jgi:methionine-rich copper-binding protein CopC
MKMLKVRTGVLAAFAASLFAGAADAHPHFKSAGPAPGSVVKTSPKAVRIQFTEDLELALSGIEIKNKAGAVQKTGTATLHPQDKKQLIVPVNGALAPGLYTVDWHVVGTDTHPQQGHFAFEVKP